MVLFVKSYPGYVSPGIRPSSVYSGPVGRMDSFCRMRSLYGDEFFLEDPGVKSPAYVTLTILNADGSDYSFSREELRDRQRILIAPRRPRAFFVVFAKAPVVPLKLRVSSPERGGEVELTPTDRVYWDRFREIGLGGLQLRWRGGR
jgi:hypothetical protein